MLERFKDYDVVCIKWETFEEKDFLVDYLKKNGYKTAQSTFTLGETILLINQQGKFFHNVSNIELRAESSDISLAYIHTKDIITLDMKKKMYLTKEQLECINYVDAELKEYEITDLYVDDFGLMVKARGVYDSRAVEDSFECFFETCIAKTIEERFYDAMVSDYDSLDHEYKMLALSRKCMKELI